MKVKLKYPVKDVVELEMRRPKVRDQIAADAPGGGDAAKEVRLFANLCMVDPAVIEELDLADYRQLQTTYSGFLS